MTSLTPGARVYCPYCGEHYLAGSAHNCLEKVLGYSPRSEPHDPEDCDLCRGRES